MPKIPLARRVLPWLGYLAFFVLCFAGFAYWSFPYARLRTFAEQRFNSASRQYALGIGELGPSGVLGLAARDVQYSKVPARPADVAGTLKVDELAVQPSLLGLIAGRQGGTFDARAGGGTAQGEVSKSEEQTTVEAEFESIDLKAIGLGDYLGLPMTGAATGTVNLQLPADAAQSQGKIDLVIRGLTVGDGKAKVSVPGMRDGFTIERLNAGRLDIEITIEDGTATVDKFAADGKDIKMTLAGTARLATPMARSRLKLTFVAKFAEAYKTRDAKTKAIFELMGFRPEIKRATTPDGSLRFLINGTVGIPQARPSGTIPRRAKPR